MKRSLLEAHLEHNSVIHGIQDILMEAIRAVELPPPAAGAEDQPQDEDPTVSATAAAELVAALHTCHVIT